MKFESWSVIQAFAAVYGLINFSMSISTISDDVAYLSGTEYLVSKSFIVSIYKYLLSIVENDNRGMDIPHIIPYIRWNIFQEIYSQDPSWGIP